MPTRTPSRQRGSRLAAAAMITAAMIAIAACAGPAEGSDREGDATIAIAITSAPRSLDPAQLDGGTQSYVWGAIYDTLLYYDNDGELQPNAAESWEYSTDGLELTFRLRDGMTFSDGEPVTADAVVANLQRNRETPGQQQSKMAFVEAVEAPDDLTVVLRFSAPDPSFVYNMALDAGVIADPRTVDENRTATDPLGSGPYVLDSGASVTGSTYVLNRREDYWNADQYPFQTLTVRVLQDPTAAFNALRTGEVDVATVPANQLSSFNENDFNIAYNPAAGVAYLNLADRDGTVAEPLGDVRVRQAINYALDREGMVEQLLFGAGTPSTQQFNLRGEAYDEGLEDAYTFDPDRARELLAEAGYPDGFDVSMPSTPLSMNYEPTISQSLRDVGIDVTWETVPAQNATASVVAGEYPMYFFINGSDVAPREVQRQLHSASQNPFNWTSPELEELERATQQEQDPELRAEHYRALNEYVVENALFAPLFFLGTNYVTSKGIEYLGDGSNSFASVRTFAPVGE